MSVSGLEIEDTFEACRTCGIYFLISSNYLQKVFASLGAETDAQNSEMLLIRMQLAAWNVEINENDGFPQYICINCIHEFQKVFKFRRSCINVQQELREMYNGRNENIIKIKTELPDALDELDEENSPCCDFIYVDDLSDNEGDGAITPFNIRHVPIKDELIEEATVPNEIPPTKIEAAGEEKEPAYVTANTQSLQQVTSQHELNMRYSAKQHSSQQNNSNAATESPAPSVALRCNLCLYIAANQSALRQHMQRIHEVKNVECHICGKEFKNSTAGRLKFHLRWHKISKHVKCAQCGFYCNSRDTLRQHMQAMHAKIACNLCGKSIASKKIKSHMREHAISVEWECSWCNKAFNSEAAREEHLWLEHATAEPKSLHQSRAPLYGVFCMHCEQMFESQEELELHMMQKHDDTQSSSLRNDNSSEMLIEGNSIIEISHDYDNEYSADITDQPPAASKEISHSNLELEESIAATSQEDEQNESEYGEFACADCPQTFATVTELFAHHKEHLKMRPLFKCHFCDKSFDLKFSLNRHLKKHKNLPF